MGRPRKEVSEENLERFQKELELAGDNVDLLLQDKKGRSKSCLLCRRRKQRCDHKLPSCTACLKAGVKCVQPARYSNNAAPIKQETPLSDNNTSITTARRNTKTLPIHLPLPSSNPTAINTTTANSNTPNTLPLSLPLPIPNPITNLPLQHQQQQPDATTIIPLPPRSVNRKSKSSGSIVNTNKDEYQIFLEKKLSYLEKMLDLPIGGSVFNRKLTQYKKFTHLLGEMDDDLEDLLQDQDLQKTKRNLHNLKNFGNGSKNILPPPPPPRSDFIKHQYQLSPINNNTSSKNNGHHLINSSKVHNSSPTPPPSSASSTNIHSDIPALKTDSMDSINFSNCIFAKYNLQEFFNYDPAFEFNEELSRLFLNTYFTRLQFKYPVLDENEIYSFHENYINNKIHSFSNNDFHFNYGKMWLIFSISAYLHMTTGKYNGLPPVRYFSTAVRHITRCSNNLTDLQKVELLALLVLYIMKTDQDSLLLYDIIKDVMQIAQFNLKLNKYNPNNPNKFRQIRIFWSLYLLERTICVAVGKSYIISEKDIDLPYFDINSFNTRKITSPATNNTKTFEENNKNHSNNNSNSNSNNNNTDNNDTHLVHFINQSLRLRRLESAFTEQLDLLPQKFKSKDILKNELPMVKKYFHDLEIWRSNCLISSVKNFENENLKLYYYRAVRLLLQPYLEILSPEDKLFRECQAAAGQICQLYKTFHRMTASGNSSTAIHTVFVAGVTLIYCMWLARNMDDERRKKLGDISKHTRPHISASLFVTMDDLKACSICLYVMTERSKFARTFRDTYDQLMNATIGNLIERCGPDSSELIYMTNFKKDKYKNKNSHSNSNSIPNSTTNSNTTTPSSNSSPNSNINSIVNTPLPEHSASLSNLNETTTNTERNLSLNTSPSNSASLSNEKQFSTKLPHLVNQNISNSSISNFKNISTMGMPPAIERVFGKNCMDDHVAFVENSQVDLQEQKYFKKKQNALAKSVLPKSLSNLLSTTTSSSATSSSNNTSSQSDNTDNETLTNNQSTNIVKSSNNNNNIGETKRNHDEEDLQHEADNELETLNEKIIPKKKKRKISNKSSPNNENENHFIVKKPNINQFDWKTFQEQAYLQQHFARQNLQAYLSSLAQYTNSENVTPYLAKSQAIPTNSSQTNIAANSSQNNLATYSNNNIKISNNNPAPIRNLSSGNNTTMPYIIPKIPNAFSHLSNFDSTTKTNIQQSNISTHSQQSPNSFSNSTNKDNSNTSADITPKNSISISSQDQQQLSNGLAQSQISRQQSFTNSNSNSLFNTSTNSPIDKDPNSKSSQLQPIMTKSSFIRPSTSISSIQKANSFNADILTGNILLSNGAHGMINNISSWTTDSLITNNTSNFNIDDNSSFSDPSIQLNQVQPINHNNQQPSQTIYGNHNSPQAPNGNPNQQYFSSQPPAQHQIPQMNQNFMNNYPTNTNPNNNISNDINSSINNTINNSINNTINTSINNTINTSINNSHGRLINNDLFAQQINPDGAVKKPVSFNINSSWEAPIATPIEETWISNEDYGFLT
ncbi:hypothetical protein TBLA_0A09760 [Henningerozyma blattae CBS 6284]|uniref:Zn(2)-C6 fungal-type domain-containing protein n=1 Tax=Henningerozyma blattae (strain ATCC 34711 / CBS 6284 / DSM 70876 / NBRC 10599 / NRRL Y-10934 / UCD 77-7) TaxID=1071380 RepID=I2GXA7_HENB6|nr:hypothetical protein TBLA_0A09760 [Tetrapisispora blattae CBS 6284]CCH58759.1 hypothetical protein TBLA_0A09760 [Tetrapisispora blattae CBS 6284]